MKKIARRLYDRLALSGGIAGQLSFMLTVPHGRLEPFFLRLVAVKNSKGNILFCLYIPRRQQTKQGQRKAL